MRVLYIIFSIVTAFFISSCDNTPDNEIILKPFKPSIVNVGQTFIYSNIQNENLFKKGVYNVDSLSLIATDENFNDLYINGILVADGKNAYEVREKLIDNNGDVYGLNIWLGYPYKQDKVNGTSTGYFKLKYNENKYDTITAHFIDKTDDEAMKFYLSKIVYNGKEYPYSPDPITIIKNE
jgi:uncharacterized lipoprotein YehR (DUF1307 family)